MTALSAFLLFVYAFVAFVYGRFLLDMQAYKTGNPRLNVWIVLASVFWLPVAAYMFVQVLRHK